MELKGGERKGKRGMGRRWKTEPHSEILRMLFASVVHSAGSTLSDFHIYE